MASLNTIKEINAPMWDQMQVFCKRIADHQIRLVLHFNKIIEKNILKDAVKITVKNNPIACAKYIENNKKSLWKFSEIDIEQVFSFQKCEKPDPLIQEAILEEIDTYAGPLMRISLIRANTDTLVLNCDHAITDAAGVKYFMYELAQNYSLIAKNNNIEKQAYTPLRSLKTISSKLGIIDKASILKVMLSSKKNAPTFQKKSELNDLQNPGFRTLSINLEEFERIKVFGRRYKATVNDMFLAIYFYTLKNILKNSNKTNRITFSSDIRTYLDRRDYDVLSNFSTIHNIDIDNNIGDFVSLLKEISTLTNVRKQMKYDMADFPIMAVLFKTMSYKKRKSIFHNQFDKIKEGKSFASPGLTNMGIIEEEKIGFDTINPARAYMLGTINHPSLLILSVSTYKKRLTLSIGSYYNEKNEVFISKLLEGLKTTIDIEVLDCKIPNSMNIYM